RDLERDRAAGDISEPDYLELKDDYTARAAAVLRAMEAGPKAGPRRGPPSRRAPSTRTRAARPDRAAAPTGTRGRRSLLVTIGVALTIVAIAGGSVALFAGSRQDGAPVTGSIPATTAERLSQAIQLDSQGQALEALKLYDAALADDPGNVQALAYKGWLLKRAGLADEAQQALDMAVALDPSFPDAHFFRGMLLLQDRKDAAGAVVEFRAFLENNPPAEMVPAVQDVLQRAEAEVAGTQPPPAG
ncbi:MAG: hypothetical protein QOD63_1610, partial [Actinomycetota bacterium]|nr:hypothetical protein [Actinomycetota bacterium]